MLIDFAGVQGKQKDGGGEAVRLCTTVEAGGVHVMFPEQEVMTQDSPLAYTFIHTSATNV